jgi:hypothetical protein
MRSSRPQVPLTALLSPDSVRNRRRVVCPLAGLEAERGESFSVRGEEERISVALANETSFSTRMAHMRAGVRLNSRVALRVEWAEGGVKRQAEGYTVDISPKGCLAIVAQGFAVGQKMQLTNLSNKQTAEAILIWRGHEGRKGWELGLELEGSVGDFWGVEF